MPPSPLDAPPDTGRKSMVQNIFLGLEVLCWVLVLVVLWLKRASWDGASEMLIILLSLLSFLYLVLPIPLLGSRGWKQHVGSHAVGFALMLAVWVLLFTLLSWPQASELTLLAAPACTLLLVTTIVLWLVQRQHHIADDFYRNAGVRLGLGAFLSVFSGLL